MTLKILTASVVTGTKEVPLSAKIAVQFDKVFELRRDLNPTPFGRVTLTEERETVEWILIQTESAIVRMTRSTFINFGYGRALGEPDSFPRIVLL